MTSTRRDIAARQPPTFARAVVALGVALPFGHTTARVLENIRRMPPRASASTDIRPAPERTLVAICDTADAGGSAAGTRSGARLRSLDQTTHGCLISACPGAPACASGHIPARADRRRNRQRTRRPARRLHAPPRLRLRQGLRASGRRHADAGRQRSGDRAWSSTEPRATNPSPFRIATARGAGSQTLQGALRHNGCRHETTAQAIQRLGLSALAEAFGRRDA